MSYDMVVLTISAKFDNCDRVDFTKVSKLDTKLTEEGPIVGEIFQNTFMRKVKKWPNMLLIFYGVHTARF